jgi:hypothetical protein
MVGVIYTCWRVQELRSPGFKKMHSTLTEGVKTDTFVQAIWNVIAMTKLVLTVILLIFLRQFPCFQLMTIYFSQLLYQILLGYTLPYETPSKNILALTNEILCSLYLMMYLMASDFNDNPDIRSAAGTGLLLIISLYVALNFLYFLVSLIAQLRGPSRRLLARVKHLLANKRGRGVVAMKPLKQQDESTIAI